MGHILICFHYHVRHRSDFPGSDSGKNLPTNAGGDAGSIHGSRRSPGGAHGKPTPVFLPGQSQGQRSLVGHSPWGRKESDMPE